MHGDDRGTCRLRYEGNCCLAVVVGGGETRDILEHFEDAIEYGGTCCVVVIDGGSKTRKGVSIVEDPSELESR